VINAIVLAAGESRRMGKPKPLLRCGDTTFLGRIVSVLRRSQVDWITVVLGAGAEAIQRSVDLSGIEVIINVDYRQGQLSSLIAALRHVPAEADAILLCLVDNPFVTPGIVDRVIAAYRETASPIVIPVHGGRRGHPTLFARALFDELVDAPADEGARHVVYAHEDEVVEVAVPEDAVLAGIDTPQQYRARFGIDP
jgi:molybdenum cofactor cytidylyltransferase